MTETYIVSPTSDLYFSVAKFSDQDIPDSVWTVKKKGTKLICNCPGSTRLSLNDACKDKHVQVVKYYLEHLNKSGYAIHRNEEGHLTNTKFMDEDLV